MNMLSFVGGLVKPVADAYQRRQQRKQKQIETRSKLAQAKLNNEKDITLTDAQWESVTTNKTNESWKDEFVTVLILWPYLQIFIGGIETAIRGEDAILLSSLSVSLTQLNALGVDIGFLMSAVVLAAVGLKVWRANG